MPSSIVSSFAEKSGKSKAEVEKLWDKIKTSVKDGGTSESDPSFYAKVTAGLKRALSIKESFDEFVERNK